MGPQVLMPCFVCTGGHEHGLHFGLRHFLDPSCLVSIGMLPAPAISTALSAMRNGCDQSLTSCCFTASHIQWKHSIHALLVSVSPCHLESMNLMSYMRLHASCTWAFLLHTMLQILVTKAIGSLFQSKLGKLGCCSSLLFIVVVPCSTGSCSFAPTLS